MGIRNTHYFVSKMIMMASNDSVSIGFVYDSKIPFTFFSTSKKRSRFKYWETLIYFGTVSLPRGCRCYKKPLFTTSELNIPLKRYISNSCNSFFEYSKYRTSYEGRSKVRLNVRWMEEGFSLPTRVVYPDTKEVDRGLSLTGVR